jgi:pantoate--beta-alanine ligase
MLVRNIAEIKFHLNENKNKTIALVPTMGALHDGHLALVKKAQELAQIVVVTIFVNKAQFNDVSDYLKYPKTLDDDLAKLDEIGVDYVFAPDENEMNNINFAQKIIPDNLKNCLCGLSRPGHFEGVVMIVSKFFDIIKPNIVIFGQKDFQQCLVVKNLIKNNYPNINIFLLETIREKSGLAMSSRNQRLKEADKTTASAIYKTLQEIKNEILNCTRNLPSLLEEKKLQLLKIGFEKIDYLEIRSEDDLKLITDYKNEKSLRIFIAVYLSEVRLIDNLKIN